ncbi:flagellar P-ring protein 1 [Iodidimonas muriae]|uniref:Flagellar P-ring protein n=1 Tax=Iodidimonas muriae TaxID=261467 RepID=A0ABQ2LFI6_9PROT|nr:flagellar basal body P-ring protein FlgI [Iodidimonas muriae]GER08572.1 flagellar P-ring protein 1 [Kordiimonadales bacterium JCM 17843]GGO15585.1 flagellar P-ring protein 1 [Iodidimonas muriae]
MSRQKKFFILLFLCIYAPLNVPVMAAQVRVKDIASFDSVRYNHLIGYGLVVGLAGTGDRLTNTPFTEVSITSMLQRLGIALPDDNLRTRNVAAVMVTANLPAYARNGSAIDVSVSAMGDATDLRGGVLLVTPLMAADGEVYAVAQGPLSVSGFAASGQAGSVTSGVPTSASVSNGAIVERELGFDLDDFSRLRMHLRNPDFTTALRIEEAINKNFGALLAKVDDLTTVNITVPTEFQGQVARFLAEIGSMVIEPDQVARVVIDENSGAIVIGANVRISEVAVTLGSITIEVQETPQVSQPAPFAEQGETVVVPRTDIAVDTSEQQRLQLLPEAPTLQELINGLNALGVGPRGIISVLQAIKSAGALHAELVVE